LSLDGKRLGSVYGTKEAAVDGRRFICCTMANGVQMNVRAWYIGHGDAGHVFYLVIAFGGAGEPEGAAVPFFMAVPLVPDVEVAWSGVGSVFTPGTPVEPPWAACSGVGLVFTPGTPVAPPWAPVALFCCATAKVLDSAKAAAKAIVPSFMFASSCPK
jgi:hypothetical protein